MTTGHVGSFVRNSYVSTLCPVAIMPLLVHFRKHGRGGSVGDAPRPNLPTLGRDGLAEPKMPGTTINLLICRSLTNNYGFAALHKQDATPDARPGLRARRYIYIYIYIYIIYREREREGQREREREMCVCIYIYIYTCLLYMLLCWLFSRDAPRSGRTSSELQT